MKPFKEMSDEELVDYFGQICRVAEMSKISWMPPKKDYEAIAGELQKLILERLKNETSQRHDRPRAE